MDENGVWRIEEQQIGEIVKEYFQRNFSMSYLTNVDEVLSTVDRVVLEEMNQELLRLFNGRRWEKLASKCTHQNPQDRMEWRCFSFKSIGT